MNTKQYIKASIGVMAVVMLCAANGGCTDNSAVRMEAQAANAAQTQLDRNEPMPTFDWSLERHLDIQIYDARQRATNTFSYAISPYTGKILWSCPSLGFPIPYATQLTNPDQIDNSYHNTVTVGQAEPNGLYPPSTAEGTWVPCVGQDGNIHPVYSEPPVTVFLQPMTEQNGMLVPTPGTTPSLSISPIRR